jgi:hypothetical protein
MLRRDMTYHDELAPRRSRWLIAAPLMFVIALGIAWSVVWYYAAGSAQTLIENWRAEQAKAGRIFTCGSQAVGGYPFRIEARCADAAVELRDVQPPVAIKLKQILVVAQVWDTKLLIAEFTGPLTAAEPGRIPHITADWTLAQASVRGTPDAPDRASIAVDGLKLDDPGGRIADAQHAEFHARVQFGSWPHNPAFDLAVKLTGASAPGLVSFVSQPSDLDATGVLHGLKDLSPKPLPVRLREWQAAGGRLEVQNARFAQGEALATATGMLSLTPRGRLEGALRLTAAGAERFIPALSGAPRGVTSPLERAPALGAIDRAVAPGGTPRGPVVPAPAQRENQLATGLLALLGQQTTLEGKPAVAMPLKFTDGAATLGPIPLGQTPPLF